MHANVRGIKSKVIDILSLAEEIDLDIMILTETKLEGESARATIQGYKGLYLNRNTAAGGVIVYHKKGLPVKLIKKNKESECIWIKVVENEDNLVIGGIYSPCEGKLSKTESEQLVKEVEMDIRGMENNVSTKIMIVGDFNAHMGNDDDGIKGNKEGIGINGGHYREMIKRNNLILMNNNKKCKGK